MTGDQIVYSRYFFEDKERQRHFTTDFPKRCGGLMYVLTHCMSFYINDSGQSSLNPVSCTNHGVTWVVPPTVPDTTLFLLDLEERPRDRCNTGKGHRASPLQERFQTQGE
jgi:hypothetical protein